MAHHEVPAYLPDSTIYLARALLAACDTAGRRPRDPRVPDAARRRMSHEQRAIPDTAGAPERASAAPNSPRSYPAATVILARALVEASGRTGTPVLDDRVFIAAKQPIPPELRTRTRHSDPE